ncbi:MAG: aldehyde dehydrogenase family protein, partial [Acidimicrobiales bacterium]|nr:aldehyde dehydrogenase family protein [Acidimicrobiales bacterium]
MIEHDKIYIDGAWVSSEGSGSIDVFDSTNGEIFGRIPAGSAADVDKAAKAARAAFDGWAATSKEERGKYCSRIAEGLM